MTRTSPYPRCRRGLLRSWLAVLVLPVALIAGCGDNNDNEGTLVPTAIPTSAPTRTVTLTPIRTATPTLTPTAGGVSAACQKLNGCDQCFINERGVCISAEACAARVSADVARCINAVSGCSQGTLGDCLPVGCDASDSAGECE